VADFWEARYEKDPSMVYREIAGEAILVPIRRRTADLESIYTLNRTGSRIWELLDGQRTLADVKAQLVQDYDDVVDAQLEADLREFISDLVELGGVRSV
jgi:hypothetical protein